MAENLVEGITRQCNRVRELIALYESLPDGAGRPAAFLMRQSIQRAEQALGSGDVIAMLAAYRDLEGYHE